MAPNDLTLEQLRGLEYDLQLSRNRLDKSWRSPRSWPGLMRWSGRSGAATGAAARGGGRLDKRAGRSGSARVGRGAQRPCTPGRRAGTTAAPNPGATQGLAITVSLRMASVPTAIYHLLSKTTAARGVPVQAWRDGCSAVAGDCDH